MVIGWLDMCTKHIAEQENLIKWLLNVCSVLLLDYTVTGHMFSAYIYFLCFLMYIDSHVSPFHLSLLCMNNFSFTLGQNFCITLYKISRVLRKTQVLKLQQKVFIWLSKNWSDWFCIFIFICERSVDCFSVFCTHECYEKML